MSSTDYTSLVGRIKASFTDFITEPLTEHYQAFSDAIGELGEIDAPETNQVKENIDKALITTFTRDIHERASKLADHKETIFKDLDTL